MTRLTDGNKIACITMEVCDQYGYEPDWSNEFFQIGGLRYDPEKSAFLVPNLEFAIADAEDWEKGYDLDGELTEDEKEEIISNRYLRYSIVD